MARPTIRAQSECPLTSRKALADQGGEKRQLCRSPSAVLASPAFLDSEIEAVPRMTRRYRPPSEPELTRRDHEDLQTCGELIDLVEGPERAGLLRDLPLAPLSVWLKKRVSFYCAARREDLTDE